MWLLQCFEWKQQFALALQVHHAPALQMNGYYEEKIEPTKIKDLNFDKEDFAQRGKKKRPLVVSPKKKFSPLIK